MTTRKSHGQAVALSAPAGKHRGGLVVLALATFVVVTTEMLPVGLMSTISTSLAVSECRGQGDAQHQARCPSVLNSSVLLMLPRPQHAPQGVRFPERESLAEAGDHAVRLLLHGVRSKQLACDP
ncbi:hypothetical protein ACFWR9_39390 [Streptomyces sp. NPDC058534]|uniref:hypothetical protein n=1 Tax=Streptomyces sp. NPDC058534 TaxID=3346541 RepID=UPI00364C0598